MTLSACCLCGATVRPIAPETFTLTIDEPPPGPKIRMAWCRPCAAVDPAHAALADALGLPDGPETGDAIAGAYSALLDRIVAQRGAQGLRRAIDVRRDAEGRTTFRGLGLTWGRPSWR